MYQVTGNVEFKRRADYMVDELAECQKANGNGYVAAIPGGKQLFADVAAGKPIQGWAPWYVIHKGLAGLRDAHLATRNPRAKQVMIGLSDWAISVIDKLDETKMQAMLESEHGGMPEVLADLYDMTGDGKYLDAARKFCHRALLDPMSRGQDVLNGWHANTQIPKVTGFERIYELSGQSVYDDAARYFWKTVVENRTYAPGGNSDHEHFFPPEQTSSHIYQVDTAETCNVYNMLKLTRKLYGRHPEPGYLDYQERALLNHIVGSHELKEGMFTYFQSLRAGAFRGYSDPVDSEWCCVGTGMENPAMYADGAFWTDQDGITIGLYLPAEAKFTQPEVTLRQETRLPAENSVRISMTMAQPQPFALRLRAPAWLAGPMVVEVNGQAVPAEGQDGLVTIARHWASGDHVNVRLPMRVRIEAAHASPQDVALLYGPVVLCGDVGEAPSDQQAGNANAGKGGEQPLVVSSLIAENDPEALARIERIPGEALAFRLRRPGVEDVTLRPYGQMQYRRYITYWKRCTPQQWQEVQKVEEAREAARRELEARTVASVLPDEQQQDVDHALRGEQTSSGIARDRHWRDAKGWFSYDVACDPAAKQFLRCSWWSGDAGRSVQILVDGKQVAHIQSGAAGEEFVDADYPMPPELTQGKGKITVRFEADPGSIAGGLYGLRVIREK